MGITQNSAALKKVTPYLTNPVCLLFDLSTQLLRNSQKQMVWRLHPLKTPLPHWVAMKLTRYPTHRAVPAFSLMLLGSSRMKTTTTQVRFFFNNANTNTKQYGHFSIAFSEIMQDLHEKVYHEAPKYNSLLCMSKDKTWNIHWNSLYTYGSTLYGKWAVFV